MRKLNADVMEGFVNSVLRKNFDKPAATPDFHKEIWELVTSNSDFQAEPGRAGKGRYENSWDNKLDPKYPIT